MTMRTSRERAAMDAYRTNREREQQLLGEHRKPITAGEILILLGTLVGGVVFVVAFGRG